MYYYQHSNNICTFRRVTDVNVCRFLDKITIREIDLSKSNLFILVWLFFPLEHHQTYVLLNEDYFCNKQV